MRNIELKTLAPDLELKDGEAPQSLLDPQPEAGHELLERRLQLAAGGKVDDHHDAMASVPGDVHASVQLCFCLVEDA